MRSNFPRTRSTLAAFAMMALSLAAAAHAQEKITLKLNMEEGAKRSTSFTMDMDNMVTANDTQINVKMNMAMDMSIEVKEVGGDGTHTMAFTYDRIRMKMSGPLTVDYDSANQEQEGDPLSRVFGGLAGQTITTVMTPQGKVKEVRGFEELAEKLGVPKEQLKQQGDQMTQMMAALPTMPVGIGDTWEATMNVPNQGGMTTTSTYTLTDRQDGEAIVKIDGKITSAAGLNGTMTGTMRVNEKTGWTEHGNMTMNMNGDIPGAGKMVMTGKITLGDSKRVQAEEQK